MTLQEELEMSVALHKACPDDPELRRSLFDLARNYFRRERERDLAIEAGEYYDERDDEADSDAVLGLRR